MAEDFEKFAILKNMFRRRSSTEFTGAGFEKVVDVTQLLNILKESGTPKTNLNPEELRKQLEQVDPGHTGKINYEQFDKMCQRLAPEPAKSAVSMEFKTLSDFET